MEYKITGIKVKKKYIQVPSFIVRLEAHYYF